MAGEQAVDEPGAQEASLGRKSRYATAKPLPVVSVAQRPRR